MFKAPPVPSPHSLMHTQSVQPHAPDAPRSLYAYGFHKDPREETVCDIVRHTIFAYWRTKSITCALIAIQVIAFCAQVAYDTDAHTASAWQQYGLLAPSQRAQFAFGELHPRTMTGIAAAWRFAAALFLHANALHLVSSLFVQAYALPFVEAKIGARRTGVVLCASGVAGVAFNALVSQEAGAGGSAAAASALAVSLTLESIVFHARSARFSFFQNAHQAGAVAHAKGAAALLYFYVLYTRYEAALFYCAAFSFFAAPLILYLYATPPHYAAMLADGRLDALDDTEKVYYGAGPVPEICYEMGTGVAGGGGGGGGGCASAGGGSGITGGSGGGSVSSSHSVIAGGGGTSNGAMSVAGSSSGGGSGSSIGEGGASGAIDEFDVEMQAGADGHEVRAALRLKKYSQVCAIVIPLLIVAGFLLCRAPAATTRVPQL